MTQLEETCYVNIIITRHMTYDILTWHRSDVRRVKEENEKLIQELLIQVQSTWRKRQ